MPEHDPTNNETNELDIRIQTQCLTGSYPSESSSDGEEIDVQDAPPLIGHLSLGMNDTERYQVGELIGRGGEGDVYEVTDRHLKRSIAVKILHTRTSHRAQHAQRFLQEARINGRLNHPGILPVYDLDRCRDGRPWFAMRRVCGDNLANLLAMSSSKPLNPHLASVDKRLGIILRVCETMAFVHDQGIVHQDIKPGNIVVGDYGEVLLIDWGTALIVGEPPTGPIPLMGTPMYMSPEQARREHVDKRSDVYCIGATAWHVLGLSLPVSATDTQVFWHYKRLGLVDPLPPAMQDQIPDSLITILHQALDPNPDLRPADAGTLLAELRHWQEQRQGEVLLERARSDFQRAQHSPDHQLFQGIIEDCHRAQESCRNDANIARLLSEVCRHQAQFALSRGEIDLAQTIITESPALDDMAPAIAEARHRQHQIHRQAARSHTLGIASLALLVLLSWLLYKDYRARQHSWDTVLAIDFTTQKTVPDEIEQIDSPYSPPVTIDTEGLHLERSLIWLRDIAIEGPLRITIDATFPSTIDGFEINSHVIYKDTLFPFSELDAYGGQFGAYGGRQHFLVQHGSAIGSLPTSISSQITSGRRYQFTYQVDHEAMHLDIDGQRVLKRSVLLPRRDQAQSAIALRTWGCAVIIHRLVVERQNRRARSTALAIGEGLLEAGQMTEASRVFADILNDPLLATLHAQAMARLLLCHSLAPASSPIDNPEDVYRRLLRDYPQHSATDAAHLIMLRMRWLTGDQHSALSLGRSLVEQQQPIPIVETLLQAAVTQPPAEAQISTDLLRLIAIADPGRRILNLDGIPLASLQPLHKLPLEQLSLRHCGITSLRALDTMPLEQLTIDGNPITDLQPLRGKALQRLSAISCPITDLSPLAGMPLERLKLELTHVSSLAALAGAPLRYLSLAQCSPPSLAPLRGMPLQHLSFDATDCRDLAVLSELPLESLAITHHPAFDLDLVARLPLTVLELNACGLTDLRALRHLPLHTLRVRNNRIVDLSPLASCRHLKSLDCFNNRISTLPLLPQSFTTLALSHNRIRSITPLADMQITGIISLTDNPLRDLRPIAAMRTLPARIECYPLTGSARPYEELLLALADRPEADHLRSDLLNLQALLDGDDQAVFHLAQRQGDRYFLPLGCARIDRASAQRLAHRVGAQFPSLINASDLPTLEAVMHTNMDIWLAEQPPDIIHDLLQTPLRYRTREGPITHWSFNDVAQYRPIVVPVLDDIGRNLVLCWPIGPVSAPKR